MSFNLPLLLIIAFAACCFWKARRSGTKLPDGPLGLPFVGNWFDIPTDKPHVKLTEWSRQYGDMFSYKMGATNVVVLNSPEVLEELCVKKGHLYSSRPSVSKQAELCTNNKRIVTQEYGDDWRRFRKVVHQLLGVQNSASFEPYQEYETRVMLANLVADPSIFYDEMARFSGSVTFSLLLGARFSKADHPIVTRINTQLNTFFRHVAAGSWLVDYLPFLDYLPEKFAPWREKARQFHTYDMGFWNVFYQRIQQRSLEGTAPDCFITRLLEEKEKSKISDGDAAGLMASLLNAGTDTTAASLQCFFKAICVDDRFARIAQAELDSVVGRDRLPGWEDQPNLPYIQAIVKELHRWSSISPLAFQHATSGNDKFRGRDIPKGTIITPNTYAVHHNPDIFEDHETFLPERYLRASDPRSIPNASKIENHYAFGIGRRVCPGQLVANASLYISVSRLLWAFKIGKKPGVEMNDNITNPGTVLSPERFECRIEPRTPEIVEVIKQSAASLAVSEMEDVTQYTELLHDYL